MCNIEKGKFCPNEAMNVDKFQSKPKSTIFEKLDKTWKKS